MKRFFLLFSFCLLGCSDAARRQYAQRELGLSKFEESEVIAFCSDCHAMPDPMTFPRHAWHDEVRRGYGFYYASGRTDLDVPVQENARKYFTQRAPETLSIVPPAGVDKQWSERFERIDISIPGVDTPAISFIESVNWGDEIGRGVLFSDMRGGGVYFSEEASGQFATPQLLGRIQNPAVARICDWDGDGLLDLMVADLGSFLPGDHERGQVVWLRRIDSARLEFETIPLATGLGRVASVEMADFNGDGLPEILVAEFGWQTTGSISLLSRKNHLSPATDVDLRRLDSRPGTIHVPVADLNGDGHPDFIALISQHHECIEAFINDGTGKFSKKRVFTAPEPAFGSSGIQLVDWNRNGKPDILYTNGDSFDSFYLKPSHGIRWLENRGNLEFEEHEIGKMPGVHRALAIDLNNDGTYEIISGAFLPRKLLKTQGVDQAEGLVLWTAASNGKFQRHVLTQSETSYAALATHTVPDSPPLIVVGHFRESDTGAALTVWKLK